MAWIVPQHPRSTVDKAGKTITDPACSEQDKAAAELIVNNWRSSHSFPLNTIQNGLRRRVQSIDSRSIVAQRIKRLESIQQKLVRFPTTRLSQLQDLGGCRAIVGSLGNVESVVRSYKATKAKHELIRLDDYITHPQMSGYRGVHMVYRYKSEKSDVYNGLRIEVQIRSTQQHAWATAVETAGTFLRQGLKSSEGETEWLRFFALMGSAIAQREERRVVPGTPDSKHELISELRTVERRLEVRKKLRAFGATIDAIENAKVPDAKYYLLQLNPKEDKVFITGFLSQQLGAATEMYLNAEKSSKGVAGGAAVLVAAGSVNNLRRAYPNYFLDTEIFLETLASVLSSSNV